MLARLTFLSAATLAFPIALHAAGGGSSTPPKTTKTTADCAKGLVWDEKQGGCVDPNQSSLSIDDLYLAAREMAYAGDYLGATRALDAMATPTDDRVMTYRGFIARKMGDVTAANTHYLAALQVNPDNLLARSYMGQGLVSEGDLVGARDQLLEIRARGGTGTWAETALLSAIETGTSYSY